MVLLSTSISSSLYYFKEKSRKLKNVFFKSRQGQDLQKFSKFELKVLAELKIINSNVLYLTYRIDKISATQKTLDAKEFYDTSQEDDHGTSDNNQQSD